MFGPERPVPAGTLRRWASAHGSAVAVEMAVVLVMDVSVVVLVSVEVTIFVSVSTTMVRLCLVSVRASVIVSVTSAADTVAAFKYAVQMTVLVMVGVCEPFSRIVCVARPSVVVSVAVFRDGAPCVAVR
jgi:hypothetical protein